MTQTTHEQRFDRGAWLTLVIALLLLVVPLLIGMLQMTHPSDGWNASAGDPRPNGTRPYRLHYPITDNPDALRPNDQVVAIEGQPLVPDAWPPLPADLEPGQTLRYTIARDGQTTDVDVVLKSMNPTAFLASLQIILRGDPILTIVSILSLLLALAVFLLWPGNAAARYLLLLFTVYSGTAFLTQAAQSLYQYHLPLWALFLSGMADAGWLTVFLPALALLMLSFPVAKGPVRRYPRLTPLMFFLLPLFLAVISVSWDVLMRRPAAEALFDPVTILAVAILCLGTAIVALLHNFLTVRDPLARAQLRWVGLGLGIGFLLPLSMVFAATGGTFTSETALQTVVERVATILTLLLPVSLAIGILRYRLFDIDVIIRKTTSYALLTALLALVYFGSIVVLQRVLSPITGESTVAVVLSTLFIAALFLPLRRRVQAIIDRRFFRKKYDAEQVLARFAATARDETDLDALTAELVRVIQETMQPESLTIWLKDLPHERIDG